MCLVGNPEELTKKKAYLAPLVERLGNIPGALSMVNNRGEDALYLAAINCPEMPYVTGYLAAAMLQKGIDISQKLYHICVSFLIFSQFLCKIRDLRDSSVRCNHIHKIRIAIKRIMHKCMIESAWECLRGKRFRLHGIETYFLSAS